MSASLVGSEMCIRDRAWREPLGPLGVLGLLPRRVGLGANYSTLAKVSGAVSYTHLTLPTICSV
eukprot:5374111-Alexandrium_andersonii.AAC.1